MSETTLLLPPLAEVDNSNTSFMMGMNDTLFGNTAYSSYYMPTTSYGDIIIAVMSAVGKLLTFSLFLYFFALALSYFPLFISLF